MGIIGGLDVHRAQITYDYIDTVRGEVRRGKIRPALREDVRAWAERFGGDDDVAFALEGTTGSQRDACRPHGESFRRALSPRERRAVRTAVRAQEAGCEPGGPVSTVGTYSSSWSLPSNVRPATISRVTSGYPSWMRSRPVLPVITGKTTTRKRSTRPASRSDRHRIRLPRVRIGLVPSCFIAATAWTASPLISRVLGHDNGGCNAEENTIFDLLASSAMAAPSSVVGSSEANALDSVANPDIRRYVFAPIKIV